jgi:C-terminal processing protease CtpA/Prc
MYSVYKSHKFVLGLVLLLGITTHTVPAKECSSLQLKQTEIEGETYLSRIRLSNGLMLESEIKKYTSGLSTRTLRTGLIGGDELRTLNGSKLYYLEPGEHSVTVELWKKDDLEKYYTDFMRGTDSPKSPERLSTFRLRVEDNNAYQVVFSLDGQVTLSAEKSLCVLDNNYILGAITSKVDEIKRSEKLPPELEKRLRVLMNKLFDNVQPLGLINSEVSQYFGAVKDDNYKDKDGGVRLLSVLPFSLAHKLGLLSGDVIVSYGDPAYSNLTELLTALDYKKEMKLEVLRNSSLVALNMVYEPVVVPQVTYGRDKNDIQKTLIEGVEFDHELQFEYERLMLEITEYYRNKNYKGRVNIVRNNTLNEQFGLIGTLDKISGSKYSIVVDEVLPHSAAKAIGLEVGDIIVSVNDKVMNTRYITHINETLKNLAVGEEYTIAIERQGKSIALTEKFTASAFLSFNLIIELDSVDIYYANLASIKSVNKDVKNFTRLLRNIQGIRSSHTKSRISGKGPSSPWQSSNKRSGKESKSSGK